MTITLIWAFFFRIKIKVITQVESLKSFTMHKEHIVCYPEISYLSPYPEHNYCQSRVQTHLGSICHRQRVYRFSIITGYIQLLYTF